MCQECGCGLPREVSINGVPASQIGDKAHSHEHAHAHEHNHPHPHAHSHPHEHGHTHDHDSHGHSHDELHALGVPHEHPHHGDEHREVALNMPVLAQNDRIAERNRGFFQAKKLLVLNVVSSPGSGKTTFIQKTITLLTGRLRSGVIVGDLETAHDAERLRSTGAPAVQITTGTVCHLDAAMVSKAMGQLDLDALDLLIIENVGNLVCPASYDLGEHLRVVLLSVTEGEDKPLKYPPIFSAADVVVVSKCDLATATEFKRTEALSNIQRLAPNAKVFEVSSRTGQGMNEWCAFLEQKRQNITA